MVPDRTMLTTRQVAVLVAERFEVTERTAKLWLQEGKIGVQPRLRLPTGRVKYDEAEVRARLDEMTQRPTGKAAAVDRLTAGDIEGLPEMVAHAVHDAKDDDG